MRITTPMRVTSLVSQHAQEVMVRVDRWSQGAKVVTGTTPGVILVGGCGVLEYLVTV